MEDGKLHFSCIVLVCTDVLPASNDSDNNDHEIGDLDFAKIHRMLLHTRKKRAKTCHILYEVPGTQLIANKMPVPHRTNSGNAIRDESRLYLAFQQA